jgi:diguanylate cyclase (GGDEF)-like protein
MFGKFRSVVRSPGAPVAALGALLCLSTIVLFLADLQTRYWSRIAQAKADAQSFAKVLTEHTVLTFEDIDRALLRAAAIRRTTLSGSSLDPALANAALRQLQKNSSLLVAIGWTDASGQVIAHSYDKPLPRDNISGMAHFIAQRDNGGDGMFISPPYRSAAGDKWFTAASRRLNNPDGSFAGIVTAPLDQSYFTKLYRSIDLGHGGSILLLHREGRILAREPERKDAVGKTFVDSPLLTRYLPASEQGAYETTSIVDGVERIAGYQAVPGLPLVLIVTYARAEVLASWYQHLYTFGLLVAAIVVIILFGTIALVRQTNNIAANTRALARINERFDIAISNMPQGLCLFDAEKRLVISNSRYQEMYNLPDELVRPGTPLSRILQFYEDRGEKDDKDVDHHVRAMPKQQTQSFELATGRKIFIQRKPLPDGGWVATHADVTDQERSQRLLAEKAAELEAMNVRFDAALNNMSQGLCMFDAEQRVVVSNARYGEIYLLTPDQIKPGTSLAQILEYRRQRGTDFAGIVPANYLTRHVREAKEVRELSDGRVVAITRQMMSTGGWLTAHEDITERARNEQRIAYLAQHDLLTGLANRAMFSERLDEVAKRLQRHGTTFTVLMLDLDKFKNVNDTLGHPAGDQLLVEVAQRLKSSLRDTDVVARLGGDEFAIIQENEKNQSEGAILLALRIIALIEQPFEIDGHQVNVGTSIGIAFAPEHGADAEGLLQKADIALYAAKAGGRNDFRVFKPELTEAADMQKSMENELRDAISRDEFELHYQPVLDARTHVVTGAEAFVRWQHPTKGLLAPDQFLPLAESTGLMASLSEWILRQACLDAAAWPANMRIAVNVAAAQLAKGNLLDVVLCALVDSGLSPDRLELEIADTVLLQGDQSAHLLAVRQLKNLGVAIALDSCGAGYSSASYLTNFPFDKIKIDRPIAQGIARRECAAVVASVIALARGLDVTTAAKGVERNDQFEALAAAGVDFVQGYLFGRPVPNTELDFDLSIALVKDVA